MKNEDLLERFRAVVGKSHVLTGRRATERFCTGFRSGQGEALCVVRPFTLLQQWKILQACVQANKIIILQAANTGLTEGSTPSGTYDRDVVLINTQRMDRLELLNDGQQVISFPGATLFALEKLLKPLKREPHSLIGSSCIGASIIGGVCNSSGGSLVERGPVYTELSLFAQVDENGDISLVNHLGIDLGDTDEEILSNLDGGKFDHFPKPTNRKASASDYAEIVRDVDAATPARFNADKKKLYETSGCAGKLAVFAVRLDTFPKNDREQVFYIGTNSADDLSDLRRHILSNFKDLPVSAEYMHQEVFDITKKYGKDTVWMIDKLGTDRLPTFFAIKGGIDARLKNIPFMRNFTDHFMQFAVRLLPDILPRRMLKYRELYEHHLVLKMKSDGIGEAQSWLKEFVKNRDLDFFECSPREAKISGLHRFAAAGAAVRYMAIHSGEVEDIIALDVALRRNDKDWLETLPAEIEKHLVSKLYYGHFMCHVMHQDYIVKAGADAKAVKNAMLALFDERGAEYPAEHNVGHLYQAKPALSDHYRCCDPTNSFNPGIGKTSKSKGYA